MITGVTAAVYVVVLVWLFMRRRFLIALISVVVVGFTARFVSVTYLDLAGPVYSIQLFRDIGGGTAAVPLLAAHVVYLSAFLIVMRPALVRQLVEQGDRLFMEGRTLTDRRVALGVFCLYGLFVGLLFFDMLRIGVIPWFAGLERFEYTEQYGGFWHHILMDYGMLLAMPLGAFYSYGVFFNGRGDNRFLLLMLAIFGYLFLAGHRFSAFYSHSTAFVMPYAAVLCWQQGSGQLPRSAKERLRTSTNVVLGGAALIVVAFAGSAVYKSYYVTRDVGRTAPLESLTHRVFVQQGELWYATWERVLVRHRYDPAAAIDGLLFDPIDPNRNTTLPYLMVAEIGDLANSTLDVGSAYSGGFPEVVFELAGPVAAYPAVFGIAMVTAGLMTVLLRAFIERRYVRLILCWYVLFPVVLLALSGMLNFLVNWKFWLKVSALVGWILIEWDRDFLRQLRPAKRLLAVETPPPTPS